MQLGMSGNEGAAVAMTQPDAPQAPAAVASPSRPSAPHNPAQYVTTTAEVNPRRSSSSYASVLPDDITPSMQLLYGDAFLPSNRRASTQDLSGPARRSSITICYEDASELPRTHYHTDPEEAKAADLFPDSSTP